MASIINWKKGLPCEDDEYLVTVRYGGAGAYVATIGFENGEWRTSGDILAWDFRPEPYNEKAEQREQKIEQLEWENKELEAQWSEIHGEMKYYEGASDALLNVFRILKKEETNGK